MRAVVVLLLFACLARADETEVDAARAAIAIAKAKAMQKVSVPPAANPEWDRYEPGNRCVVFVRCEPRKIAGVLVYYEPDGFGDTGGAAIVVSADGKQGHWLPATATDVEIQARLEAGRKAIPFRVYTQACSA